MPSFERGPYEPPPEDPRVYDGAEEEDDEGSRLPLLIVIALLVLAAFGGVVWLAYSQGVARGHSDTPQMIAAQPGPVKTAPTDDAAASSPSQIRGLKIYENPAPNDDQVSDDGSAAENNAPPAQEAPVEASKPAPAALKPALTAAKPAGGGVAAPPPVAVKKPPAPVPETADDNPPAATPVVTAAKPPPSKPADVATAAPAPLTHVAPAPAAASGSFMLQIGAYKSDGEASGAWSAYKGKHAGALGGASSDTQKVDLGAKGTWYRLRVGPFASRAAATAACEKLKADGGTCFLAH